MNTDVVVIGAGPAGMMAAIKSAEKDKKVALIDKNKRAGRKLLLTGNGRCNVTNAIPNSELIKGFYKNGKFLYKALSLFSSYDLIDWLSDNNVPTVIENNNRVFPKSQHSSDILKALVDKLNQLNVKLIFNTRVTGLITNNSRVAGVNTEDGKILCDSVIIATGGKSWINTGSDGDGYEFAKSVGHSIVNVRPALTGIEIENYSDKLMGISFKNIVVKVYCENKLIVSDIGDIIFTHYGLSGPVILNISRFVNISNQHNFAIALDLLPNINQEEAYEIISNKLQDNSRKQFKNVLSSLLPERFIAYSIEQNSINGEIQASQVKRKDLNRLITYLKQFKLQVKRCRPFSEAMVTAGGVKLKEVDPSTMQSKLCSGLYIVGETLDIDGRTGGYNLQAAFATGFVAGINV